MITDRDWQKLAKRLPGFGARPPADADRVFLEELYVTCHEIEVLGIPPARRAAALIPQCHLQLEQYAKAFPDAVHRVITRRREPVGRVILDDREAEIHVVDLGFLPEVRGGGWGGAVVKALQRAARRAGKGLSCFVFVDNVAGRRFWARHGFADGAAEGYHRAMFWGG